MDHLDPSIIDELNRKEKEAKEAQRKKDESRPRIEIPPQPVKDPTKTVEYIQVL